MRLIYKAEKWKEGLNVTCYYLDPNLTKSGTLTFKEIGDGLYYLDIEFVEYGKYTVVVFEDGDKKWSQVYDIKGESEGMIIRGGDKGPGVINV